LSTRQPVDWLSFFVKYNSTGSPWIDVKSRVEKEIGGEKEEEDWYAILLIIIVMKTYDLLVSYYNNRTSPGSDAGVECVTSSPAKVS